MVSQVKSHQLVSISEVARLIATVGDEVTTVVVGEPGTGKTSILDLLRLRYGDEYEYVYLDCPTLGDGDLHMLIPNRDTHMLESYISALLKFDSGKPVIIMLDEFLKVNKLMKVLFTRLMLERAVGSHVAPKGSKIFATSNLASDGVNDTIEAHVGNRVMMVEMAKPNHKEWLAWAVGAGISALTRAVVAMKPALLQSYRSLSANALKENPYIFNPTVPCISFVTPRSLAKADVVVRNRKVLGEELTRAALAGVVGQPAAELFATFFLLEKDMLPIADILKAPDTIAIPSSVGALLLTMNNAIDELETQDDLTKFLRFAMRIESDEYRDVFMSQLCESPRTARMALQNADVNKWYEQNYKILTQ